MSLWSFGPSDLWDEYAQRYYDRDWRWITTTNNTPAAKPFAARLDGDTYKMTIELPGVNKSEVSVISKDSKTIQLVIDSKNGSKYSGKSNYPVPFDFDHTTASATMIDGLLTIQVQRAPPDDKAKIEVK